jgi:mycofactocin precursor
MTPQPRADENTTEDTRGETELMADALIEEVSIDGMCGVY